MQLKDGLQCEVGTITNFIRFVLGNNPWCVLSLIKGNL